jgi:YD repeat-containing protein
VEGRYEHGRRRIARLIATSMMLVAVSATSVQGSTPPTGTRTFAYHANGKLAGWVRREGPRSWWASDGGNSSIYRDRKGGHGITEGFHTYWYAWPASPTRRDKYVVWEGPGRPERTNDMFLRVSPTRWNVLRAGHLTGYTKGPDGIAAALGFYMWGDELLPD